MPASTKRRKINLRFSCQNSTDAQDENDDNDSLTRGGQHYQPTAENAAHRFCSNNERPQDGEQNYDPSKDVPQEEPTNPKYLADSRASPGRDKERIRKQKSSTVAKNKELVADMLEGEIPSKAQTMSNMITSLREKVDDLNLSLDAKDEIISNYENYIDDMKKKMAGQKSGSEKSRLRLVSTNEFPVEEGVNHGAEAMSGRGTVNYSEKKEATEDEAESFGQIENADSATDVNGEMFQLMENRRATSHLIESAIHGKLYAESEPGKSVECEAVSLDLPRQKKAKSKKKWWKKSEDCYMEQKQKASSECQTKESSLKKLRWKRNNVHLGKTERRTERNADDLLIELRSRSDMLANYRQHIDRLTNEREILSGVIKDKCNNAEVLEALRTLNEYRCSSRDWIIESDEIHVSGNSLGVGAWGTVHEGSFRGCPVAVKQIHELILSPQNRRMFEREMSIASRCRHPNLLQFIGATNDNGSPLFVTELLDTDLRRILSQQELLQDEIVCIALDVARGLNYLHLNKPFPIMHRDISSSNVLLWKRGDSWRAKLSDYGAANFMRENMTVNPGAWVYSAPEAQTSYQTPKVDVYSFGLLLCEMYTRELPDPTRVSEQIGLINNDCLRDLSLRCIAYDPEARPDMSEVVDILYRAFCSSSGT